MVILKLLCPFEYPSVFTVPPNTTHTQGMGGQLDYFGLWLSGDYGRGHSKASPRCSTYGSPVLSSAEEFEVQLLELWGVGEPLVPEEQASVCVQCGCLFIAQSAIASKLGGFARTLYSHTSSVHALRQICHRKSHMYIQISAQQVDCMHAHVCRASSPASWTRTRRPTLCWRWQGRPSTARTCGSPRSPRSKTEPFHNHSLRHTTIIL